MPASPNLQPLRLSKLLPNLAIVLVIALYNLFAAELSAQESTDELLSPAAGELEPSAPVRVFIDCRRCDSEYLRQEITYIDHVRDKEDSEVHVFITREFSGSGTVYELEFLGSDRFSGIDITLGYRSSSTDTRDEQRAGLLRILELGLVRYVLETPQAEGLRVAYQPPKGGVSANTTQVSDPWNSWVFRTRMSTSIREEDRRDSHSFEGFFSASRTTEAWRYGLSIGSSYRESNFVFDDGSTLTDTRRDSGFGAQAVKSLGSHWGIGAGISSRRSTFLNLRPSYRGAVALEYNYFPYSESSKQALRFSYFLGAADLQYQEITVLGRTEESIIDQGILVSFDARKAWGSSELDFEASHLIDDTSKYRIALDGEIDYRILRGLSVSFWGRASLVRDQIYLPGGGATAEEILLQQRALETDFRFEAGLGLSYTFGSIYNNVVNPRLRGATGGFHRIFS